MEYALRERSTGVWHLENLSFVPREQVFRECSQVIGSYIEETERLRAEVALHEKELRIIDPQLVNEQRFYTDDWILIQLVKTHFEPQIPWFCKYYIHGQEGSLQEEFSR